MHKLRLCIHHLRKGSSGSNTGLKIRGIEILYDIHSSKQKAHVPASNSGETTKKATNVCFSGTIKRL